MINLVDLLLKSDESTFKLPKKEVEITRLSKILGSEFKVTCTAISVDKYEEIQEATVDMTGEKADIDINNMQALTVMEGVLDESGAPLFFNKELQKKFGAVTPKDLVRRLLLSGEISKLYQVISDLSGFSKDSVEEIKN